MRSSKTKQGGHAALLFALIIPGMWGFFTLAIDGSRALQTKARLGDASEVAALALAARNSSNLSENKKLAQEYISTYIPASDVSITNVERSECHVSNNLDCDGANRYSQYSLEVSINQDAWLPTQEFVGFGDKYEVAHAATARKYQGDSIDVSFVMDYSGSMGDPWKGKAKYKHVRDIINDVLDELETYQGIQEINNKVSLVPYSEFTARPSDDFSCGWGQPKPMKFVDELYYKKQGWAYKLDAQKTVDKWKHSRATDKNMVCAHNLYDNHSQNFKNVPFVDKFDQLRSDMKNYRPGGWTASYQGIIKSAQYFEQLSDPNPRQLMVILSDGDDKNGDNGPMSRYEPVPTKALIEHGLCDDIRAELNSRKTLDNRPVTFQIALIGFDYKVGKNPLTQCVGEDNVYDAANPDELLDIILNLISEEIGHLK
ncbi:membrane associated secretion system protein [Vibrio tubiashii]|uniref:Membrane associated secretion system protein n=1 Tax=Vibrio tubiashii TaxID=29498 RepID=A0AAE5GUS2_9VIBR|nr:TadE/TadG family type IV pilus assembly protein [Vibrio tubiashii]NOI83658.1 membrane associated secretion system protein [Vibrio tubiashii]